MNDEELGVEARFFLLYLQRLFLLPVEIVRYIWFRYVRVKVVSTFMFHAVSREFHGLHV